MIVFPIYSNIWKNLIINEIIVKIYDYFFRHIKQKNNHINIIIVDIVSWETKHEITIK